MKLDQSQSNAVIASTTPQPVANIPDPPKMLPVVTVEVITSDGDSLGVFPVRPGLVVEMLVGETLRIMGTPEPKDVKPDTVGNVSEIVRDLAGGVHRVAALVCEPKALDRITKHLLGQARITGSDASPQKARRLLRSLANHCERFDGTAEKLYGVNLSHYG